jgi:hypothetical protein
LVECMLCKHKVIGSSPIISKKYVVICNIFSLQVGLEPTS